MFYYFHRILFKLNFFKRWNVTFNKRLYGKLFIIPVLKETGYYNLLDKYETWMDNLLRDLFLLTDGLFIDAGMNIGQTLLKVAALDGDRKYVGFEPNPVCFNYCFQLIKANKLQDYSIYPVGLFNDTKILTLFLDKEFASGASVSENFRNNKERYPIKVNVPVFRGDDVLQQNKEKVGILKMDVEGVEYEAINGLYNTLKANTPFIIIEILPVYSLESENGQFRKKRELELLAVLFELGYKMYRINEKEEMLVYLDEIEVHQSMALTNYLFVHNSKLPALKSLKYYKFQ